MGGSAAHGGTHSHLITKVNNALEVGCTVVAVEAAGGFGAELAKAVDKGSRPQGVTDKGRVIAIPKGTAPPDLASCLHIALTITL